MNAFGYRPDLKITDVLMQGKFTVSAEVIPPRNGAEQAKLLSQIQSLVNAGAQFLSVTKGAGGSLRGGSLPIAQTIKEQLKVPCIAHFTCRDLTVQEVENQLMDHHYFGVRNILALRGDPPTDQPEWSAQTGAYPYAYQLIRQINALNQGEYLSRPTQGNSAVKEKTDFCIGAAVYPEHPDESERLEFFKLKVEAGAQYAISQMLYNVEAYSKFLEQCAKAKINIPILPGSRILKTKTQALKMASRFQVSMPKAYLAGLSENENEDSQKRAVDQFFTYVEALKKAGAPGVHVFVLSDTQSSCFAIEEIKKALVESH
jgi:methylenetetrahydrofolate reductase (NADPH)